MVLAILSGAFMNEIWASLFVAWGVQAASLLSPGPSVLFLLSVASSKGRTHALSASIGIGGAAVVWSTATFAGLSAMLSDAGQSQYVMKIVAAIYLSWLAWKSIRSAASSRVLAVRNTIESGGLRKSMGMGFVMQISNSMVLSMYGRTRRWIEATLGALIAAAAIRLATSREV